MLLALLLAAPSFAEEPSTPADDAAYGKKSKKDSKDSKDSKSASKDNKDDGSSDDGGFLGNKRKWLKWWWQPYVQPGGGAQIDTSNGNVSATLGATVGTKYWKKKWQGDLHVGGTYTIGTGSDGLGGYSVLLGNDFGRREKYWGAQVGLAGTYNGYTSTSGESVLDSSVGLLVPIEVTVGPRKYYAFGGIQPGWYLDPDRQRGAYGKNPLPLFGDEFSWTVGAGLNLSAVDAELGWTSTTTSAGTYGTPTVSVVWNP